MSNRFDLKQTQIYRNYFSYHDVLGYSQLWPTYSTETGSYPKGDTSILYSNFEL